MLQYNNKYSMSNLVCIVHEIGNEVNGDHHTMDDSS